MIFRRPPSRGRIWVPVSGKVDPSDVNFESALRRELAEETGIRDPAEVRSLDWSVDFEHETGTTWRLHAFVVRLSEELSPKLSAEHDAFEWVTAEEALGRLHYPDNRDAVRLLLARKAEFA